MEPGYVITVMGFRLDQKFNASLLELGEYIEIYREMSTIFFSDLHILFKAGVTDDISLKGYTEIMVGYD